MYFYLLNNDRMVVVEKDVGKEKASLGVLDMKTGLTTKTSSQYEFSDIYYFKELSEQKIIINSFNFTYIYNHIINQIESIIIGGNDKFSKANIEYLLIKGVIITECSKTFFFYDETTLQKIFELKQGKKKLSYLITLSNGSVQAIYEPSFDGSESESEEDDKNDKNSKEQSQQIKQLPNETLSTPNKYDNKTLVQSNSINISL